MRSKPCEIYIGRGFAWIRTKGQQCFERRFAPTLPPSRIFTELEADVPRVPIYVSLSASICPPIDFEVPDGVFRWSEIREIALATAAARLGLRIEDITCQADPFVLGVAAALPTAFISSIHKWASTRGTPLNSLRPMWLDALASTARSRGATRNLIAVEPDAATAFVQRAGGSLASKSMPSSSAVSTESGLVRWLNDQGLGAAPTRMQIVRPSATKRGIGWQESWKEIE